MLIAVSAILLVLGVLAYRRALFGQAASRKDKGQSRSRKAEVADVGLLVLRLVVLLLFAAVFIGAVFSRAWTERSRRVAVMLDISESMTAVGAESAAAAVAEVFPLPTEGTGQEWVFADSAEVRSKKPAAGSQGAKRTRIGVALKTVGKTRPGAVVLLSDGQDNGDVDAVAAARDIGVPVYTVGFGGRAKRNAGVGRVVLPAVVYSGETVEVQVRVLTTGFDAENEPPGGAVSTTQTPGRKEDGNAVPDPSSPRTTEHGMKGIGTTRIRLRGQEREVPIGSGTSEQDVQFRLVFDRPGRQIVEASLDSMTGESNYADNRRSTTVDVKPGRVRVAYVTNRPGPGTRMMLRALGGDERIQVESLVAVSGALSDERGVLNAGVDAFILDDVVENGSPAVWQSVADRVQAGAGVLLLAGPSFQPGPSIGGIVSGPIGRLEGGPYTPELASAGSVLPWWKPQSEAAQSGGGEVDLGRVPPFSGLRQLPGGDSSSTNRWSAWLVARENGVPLLMEGKAGRGKVVYLAGYPLWRWGFGSQENPEQTSPLSALLTGVVRYLAESDTSPFWLQVDRPDIYQGQRVHLTARAVAPDGRPWTGLSVMVAVRTDSSSLRPSPPGGDGGRSEGEGADRRRSMKPVSVPMTETGAGVYEASLEALRPGQYQATALVGTADTVLGMATTEFAVADQPVELASTGMNEGLLRAIAEASDGRFMSADSLAREGSQMTFGSYERRLVFDPRRAAWVYVLIAFLAGAEWLMRRRRGLL